MSSASPDGRQVNPSAALTATRRSRADGHADLASDVERVHAYLRRPPATHTEIAAAGDRVVEQGEALPGEAPTERSAEPGGGSPGPDLRAR